MIPPLELFHAQHVARLRNAIARDLATPDRRNPAGSDRPPEIASRQRQAN